MSTQLETAFQDMLDSFTDPEIGYATIPATLPAPVRAFIMAYTQLNDACAVEINHDGSFDVWAR